MTQMTVVLCRFIDILGQYQEAGEAVFYLKTLALLPI